jgi:manganese-dependent ADP-ribose/CDP-alcohol diphosphatase
MNFTRRHFLRTAAIATVSAPAISRADSLLPSSIIGLVADAQFADIEAKGTRFYRQSVGKLSAAIEHFNGRDLAFCVHLGDLIDREWKSFDEITKPLSRSRHRWHQLLGNHDFDVLDELKSGVPKRLGMAWRYGSFDHEFWNFRFVVLDTNDVSTYAHATGSPAQAAAKREFERAKATKLSQAQPWNGAIGPAQLAWFDRTCAEAKAAKKSVIVFAHHPVWPDDQHNVWNSAEVLAVIDRHPNVIAWINGHNHAGNFAERNGTPFLTMRGMVETAGTTAFATLDLHSGVLTGYGREPSRELRLRRWLPAAQPL